MEGKGIIIINVAPMRASIQTLTRAQIESRKNMINSAKKAIPGRHSLRFMKDALYTFS